jgi:hypothetical protein
MTNLRTIALRIVVAHCIFAIGHLFLAARILPGPDNNVSGLAIILIGSGHLVAFLAIWKLSAKLAGYVSLIFFLAALSADLYEHFLHVSANNVFMVASSHWTAGFDASVIVLVALELLGSTLGVLLAGGWPHVKAA